MRYDPVGLVRVRAAWLPPRVKTSVSPGTGASQGCPAMQIGEIGPRVTIPRRPLCVVAAAPEAATSDAITRAGAIRRIDRIVADSVLVETVRAARRRPSQSAMRRFLRRELADPRRPVRECGPRARSVARARARAEQVVARAACEE